MKAMVAVLLTALLATGCAGSREARDEMRDIDERVAAANRELVSLDARRGSFTAPDGAAIDLIAYYRGSEPQVILENRRAEGRETAITIHYEAGRLLRYFEERPGGGQSALYFGGARYVGGTRSGGGGSRPGEDEIEAARREAAEARGRAASLLAGAAARPVAAAPVPIDPRIASPQPVPLPTVGTDVPVPGVNRVHYTCEDGTNLTVDIAAGGEEAAVTADGVGPIVLPRIVSASGARFGDASHMLDSKGSEAWWTAGRSAIFCRRV